MRNLHAQEPHHELAALLDAGLPRPYSILHGGCLFRQELSVCLQVLLPGSCGSSSRLIALSLGISTVGPTSTVAE